MNRSVETAKAIAEQDKQEKENIYEDMTRVNEDVWDGVTSLETLSHRQLQHECKELGLKANGAREDLIQRIRGHLEGKITSNTQEASSSPREIDELIKSGELPEHHGVQERPCSADDPPVPVEVLVDECNKVMAGAGVARWNPQNPKVIELRGGPRKMWDVTLKQPRSVTLNEARTYAGRVRTADKGDFELGAKGSSQGLLSTLDDMTPAELAQLAEKMSTIMQAHESQA